MARFIGTFVQMQVFVICADVEWPAVIVAFVVSYAHYVLRDPNDHVRDAKL